MTTRDKKPSGFFDDSAPVPAPEIPDIARRALAEYYQDQSPNAIDLENLVAQVEEFAWENASYRIDLFFSQAPSFLPFNSDFVMAHRMWMRRSGEIIRSEPVYRAPNLNEGVTAADLPPERRGFFPGNRAFVRELHFIDHALKNARRVAQAQDAAGKMNKLMIDVSGGMMFLEEVLASIVEKRDLFTITIEWKSERAGTENAGIEFGPFTIVEFSVMKSDGAVSPFVTRRYTPPALA